MQNRKCIGLLGLAALAFGLVLTGCDSPSSSGDSYPSYMDGPFTVEFKLNGGGGTPPESIIVEKGKSIILPGQGNMIAPGGSTFQGWYSVYPYPMGTGFKAGESATIIDNVGTWTYTAIWRANSNINFDLGEVSGTPPASMIVEYGKTITLPEVIAPEGRIFNGWRTDVSIDVDGVSKYYFSVGESITIYQNYTFTARWANKKYAREGIYVSLISFAGNATLLKYSNSDNDFIFLDSNGKSSLSSILNYSYSKAAAPGTALFYGVHKGLANLTANEGEFLTDISSVNLITFTDGLDNGSFGASTTDPIEGKKEIISGAYATYVHDEIGSRKINGKPITAYSVGVKGSDVTDDTQFAANLGNVASQGNVHEITNFNELETVFTDIAETLTFASHFSMTSTGNDPGTIVRMTFDATANAEASSKYLEGTLGYSDGVWTLANVAYGEGITSDAQSGATIIGTVSDSNVRFLFRNISGYDPVTATVQQWTKSAGSSVWQINSEYGASGSTSTSPVLIQLVLDASTSLNDTQIGQIRSAVTRFIDALYSRVTGGGN